MADRMPVPTQPEPLEVLHARYPRALEVEYDMRAIIEGNAIRPGEVAANCFDFEDGLRLVVSRERMPEGEVVLHVSASFPDQCRIADEFRLLSLTMPKRHVLDKWLASIPERFRELSDDPRPLKYLGQSVSLIPHWYLEEGAT